MKESNVQNQAIPLWQKKGKNRMKLGRRSGEINYLSQRGMREAKFFAFA